MEFVPGWASHAEDRTFLRMRATRTFSVPAAFTLPKRVSHRNWVKVRNQGSVGSCTGFGRTNGQMILNYIDTQGREEVTLSAMWAYLMNQKACGLFGADQGATIAGAIQSAGTEGEVLEDLFPYPGRYVTSIPAAATAASRKHRLLRHTDPRSSDEVIQGLGSGLFVYLIGVDWTNTFRGSGERVEDYGTNSQGGHCMLIAGYTDEFTDGTGRPYLELLNSHGTSYGRAGWKFVAPRVVDQIIQHQNAEIIGMTDIEEGFLDYRPFVGWEW